MELESKKPGLHALAAEEVKALQAKGIEPTLDEIILLNDLARRVDDPEGGTTLPAGTPARAGDVVLWPFTIQADVFYSRFVQLFTGKDRLEVYLLGFTLANARVAGAFDTLTDYTSAERAVMSWSRSVACTYEELAQAIYKVTHEDNDKEIEAVREALAEIDAKRFGTDKKPVYWEDMIARLVSTCGGSPEMWGREVSIKYLLKQLRVVIAQRDAEADSHKDIFDPLIRAQRELGFAVMQIEADHGK